jgi:hypothetical protein
VTAVSRTKVRLRRLIDSNLASVRRVPALVLSLFALAAVSVALFLTTSKSDGGWTELLKGFSANVVTVAVLAAFAYVIFILRFRRAKLSEYLERYRVHEDAAIETPAREPAPAIGGESRRQLVRARRRGAQLRAWRPQPATRSLASRDALVHTIVDELLTVRPPRSCLLVGAADAARLDAFAELPALLVERKRVPIVVDVRRERSPSSIPALTRSCFVRELVGAAGDDASGGRVFAHLLARRKAVALVVGLEAVSAGTSRRERRETLAALLMGCLTEGLPFVATLPDELAPSISEIAVLRVPPVTPAELAAHVTLALGQGRPASDPAVNQEVEAVIANGSEPTRDPTYLELARLLLLARVRRGRSASDAVADLFADPRAFRRHLAWMCEWALACPLDQAMTETSAVALALRTIGIEAHYRQELFSTWGDATRGLDRDEERRFAAGATALSQKWIIQISAGEGETVLRLSHPGWLAFAGALGLGVDPERWIDLLRPGAAQATLDALTAALLLDTSVCATERSFLRILEHLRQADEREIALDMALAVLAALQLDDGPVTMGDAEVAALEQGWRGASDAVRLLFVSDVDFRQHPPLVDFLWRQVVPPAFHENPYRIRRAICERLASLAGVAWGRLGPTWVELAMFARDRDLSAPMRRVLPDWEECGLAVASLCWVLPSLVVELEGTQHREAVALVHRLREIALKDRERPPGAEITDIGIEISLAEGFKIAAGRIRGTGAGCPDWWYEEARGFLDSAKSWASQQVLLHALALADDDEMRTRRLAEETMRSPQLHAFVREAAALVVRALDSGSRHGGLRRDELRQYVWLDDVQALDDGGLELVPEAHRLLGLSTLLINLAEHAFAARSDGLDSRDRALTSHELPRCFRRANHTATMFGVACDCEFGAARVGGDANVASEIGLCGPTARGQVGHRRFSRAFTKRAEATCGAPIVSGRRRFSRHAFREVWRELDRQLAAEQVDGTRT